MNDEEMLNVPKIVEDIEGDKWSLDKMIGRGGQGAVYRTKDINIAVKFLLDKDGKVINDEKKYDQFQKNIDDIVIIRLDNDVTLCKPLRMLKKPLCGYIMHLLSDLKPIDDLIYNPSKSTFQEFLTEGAALDKKIQVLIELSRVLAKIHSNGLVYSDISPNNVFYSDKDIYSKVWLIDCDNLHYMFDRQTSIYTPSFGAPEIVAGASNNTPFSDSFSFAIIAFKMLASRHPFEQDYTDTSTSDGWDASTKSSVDTIEANDVLWICDKNHKNYKENKEFVDMFLTNKIFELFDKTFSENGRKVPSSRPTMRAWYEALIDMYNKIWKCDRCDKFYLLKNHKCLFCDSETKINWFYEIASKLDLPIFSKINDDYKDLDKVESLKDIEEFEQIELKNQINYKPVPIYNYKVIYNFEIDNLSMESVIKPILMFKINPDSLEIHNFKNMDLEYYEGNTRYNLDSDKKIYKGKDLIIRFSVGPELKFMRIRNNG